MKRLWYNNGTKETLIREGQQIPDGFVPGRIPKETEIDRLSIKFPKELIYQKYIVENIAFHLLYPQLGITKKQLRKLLTRYEITKGPKDRSKNQTYRRTQEEIRAVAEKSSKTQKENWKNKSEEEKLAYREKQKQAHSTESFRQTISEINKNYNKTLKETDRELYDSRNKSRSESCKKTWRNPELIKQRNETAKINREKNKDMLCRTIAEQKMYDVLIKHYPDLQYDTRVDERYPFFCDFYIPSIDTFIELQAHPSHGRLPIKYLSVDEYSKYSIKYKDVFAVRDVEKERVAEENKIHLIRIYPRATIEENIKINEKEDIDLVNLCYYTQK